MTEQDVIVIGGGIAGLTAAAVAARNGARVVVLERKPAPGGRATTAVIDGFACNQGAHALYAAGPAIAVLERLGITPLGAKPPLAAQGHRGDVVAALPTGPGSVLTTSLLSPASRVRMAAALAKLQTAKTHKIDDVPYGAWVDDLTGDPGVREIFHALARLATYANAPGLVSAGAVVAQLQSGAKGVWYLDHGWQQLVDGLERVAVADGVSIVTGTEAKSVSPGAQGTWEVAMDGGSYTAPAVIIAGLSPSVSARLVGLDADALAHSGPAAEAAVLDLRLDQQPEHRFVLGLDRPTYFSVHGPPAHMAPEGKAAAIAMKYLPVGEPTTLEQDRSDLDRVAAAAGADDVVGERFLRRMTVTHGIPLASQGGLAGRPAVDMAERPGVFLAGDWVGGAGMLVDASFASADTAGQAAASIAMKDPVGALP